MGRIAALCLGSLTLAEWSIDHTSSWIDLRPIPPVFLLCVAGLLLLQAWRPSRCSRLGLWTLAGACALNAVRVAQLDLPGPAPLSISAILTIALVAMARAKSARPSWLVATLTATCFAVTLPLAQSMLLGSTDYRRPAEAIVVFGAKCNADGRPSTALADRMRTACALFREGLAPAIFLSGGPGVGPTHETEAMRAYALAAGVPASAIRIDTEGLSTRATVAHTTARRVLAVSQDWHLPRIKMAYRRAGIEAFTVPAGTSDPIPQTPLLMLREVAAYWWYWIPRSS